MFIYLALNLLILINPLLFYEHVILNNKKNVIIMLIRLKK